MTVVYAPPNETRQKASQISLLPLLVVLFLLSYGILTLLVVEQGRTIQSQRSLLGEMLKDSSQLAALKGKLAREEFQRSQEKAAAESDEKQVEPGTPAAPQKHKDSKRPGKSARSPKGIPHRPAADLEDIRRSTRAI